VVAVAACNDQSKRSVYSDYGNAICCAFPSSDFGHAPFNHPEALTPGIWTTDRLGSFGYNPGDGRFGDVAGKFTNDFGGTSSACPGAAGVVALILSANNALRWNEVKDILRRACDRIDPQGGQYDANGHSKFYGHGRLNAETAVTLAKGAVGRVVILNKVLNEPIPDLGSVEGTIDATETTPVDKAAVYIRLEHTYIGDLLITVMPPSSSGLPQVVLHNRAGGSRDNLEMLYDPSNTPALAAYSGKKCNGMWTVRIEDRAAQDSGMLVQIGLHLFLSSASPVQGSTTTPRISRRAAAKTNSQPRGRAVRPRVRG
jgi:subtilisin-like proprotein convertase family protein